MLSNEAIISVLFALAGGLAGAVSAKLSPAGGIFLTGALLYALLQASKKMFSDVDVNASGIIPYIGTWFAVLVFLANA